MSAPLDGASPKEYEIRTLTDFAKVPPERLAQCLSEFAGWVNMAREVAEAQELLRDLTGDPEGVLLMDCFHWIDDSEPGLKAINIITKETGESTRVDLK